jgi:hypothetical protein
LPPCYTIHQEKELIEKLPDNTILLCEPQQDANATDASVKKSQTNSFGRRRSLGRFQDKIDQHMKFSFQKGGSL